MSDKSYSKVIQSSVNDILYINALGRLPWVISQVSIEVEPRSGAPAGSTGVIRKNGTAITPIFPPFDAASGPPPIELDPGVNDEMTVELQGCVIGSSLGVFIVYEIGEGR